MWAESEFQLCGLLNVVLVMLLQWASSGHPRNLAASPLSPSHPAEKGAGEGRTCCSDGTWSTKSGRKIAQQCRSQGDREQGLDIPGEGPGKGTVPTGTDQREPESGAQK